MSLVIATLVSTVIAAGIPANVVVRQNPNIPNLPNMPSELAGLLDGVNIPADMAGLLGATNVAGLAGLLNAEDMQHVSEALQWAGDSERMFNDPRYQSLQSIVLSPEFSTMNEQEMRSVNQAIGSIAAEYHSNNPAWRTRSDWGDDDDDNDDDDTRTFNPAMVATGAGSRTTGASRNDDDDDDDTRTFNPTVVATATGSSTTGSPRSDDDDDDDDDDVNEKGNSQSVAVSGPGSAPAASATGAASSAGQAGSTAASAASSAASAASSAATSATAAVGSAADSAAASVTAAVGSATDSAAASATGNVGVSNGVPMAGAAIVFVAALL
jgi:hypothetical protein